MHRQGVSSTLGLPQVIVNGCLREIAEDAWNAVSTANEPAFLFQRGHLLVEVLGEWRRVSIPQWRDILQESIKQSDAKREEYARWMLREVLLDPNYEEPEQ